MQNSAEVEEWAGVPEWSLCVSWEASGRGLLNKDWQDTGKQSQGFEYVCAYVWMYVHVYLYVCPLSEDIQASVNIVDAQKAESILEPSGFLQ